MASAGLRPYHAARRPHQQRLPAHHFVSPRSTGPLPNTTEAWGSRLLIATVDMNTMHNVTFICNATNPLGSGQNQITVLVTGEMSSDQEARVEQDGPQGWIWGCVVEMIAGHRSQISSAQAAAGVG